MNGIVAPPCNKVTVRSTRDSGSEHNRAISRIIRSSVSVIVPLLIQKRQSNKIFRKSRTRKLPVSLYPKRTDYGSPGSSRKTSDPCTSRRAVNYVESLRIPPKKAYFWKRIADFRGPSAPNGANRQESIKNHTHHVPQRNIRPPPERAPKEDRGRPRASVRTAPSYTSSA